MTCYVIDPDTKTVTRGEYSGNYRDLYGLIGHGCETFDALAIDPARGLRRDVVFCDDEGLLKVGLRSYYLRQGDDLIPMVGRGIVLGTGPAPLLTLAEVQGLVTWADYVTDGDPPMDVEQTTAGIIRVTNRAFPPQKATGE
jgi:hypothetical protein